ncbi:hypothetical protein [Variovorax boronicumulans]|uniref:hypothetical protein n=1 Tax=Variovorax boronicumulans TaxID=436515 RepID=UPI0027D8C610|nr:hypothetical protein [Variovorax boronicumulans]
MPAQRQAHGGEVVEDLSPFIGRRELNGLFQSPRIPRHVSRPRVDAYWQFDHCKDHLVVCGSFAGFDRK